MAAPPVVPKTFVIDDVIALLKESLADGHLDAGEVLKIAMKVAEKASALSGLSGEEKKAIVIHVVEKAIREAVPAEQAEQVGSTVALQVLPAVLDIAVAAARGRLALQAAVKQKVSLGCLVDCFAGLFGRKTPQAKEPEPLPESPTQESVAPPPVAQPEPSPEKETPAEPTAPASPEAPPQESRPAEETETQLPSTASDPSPQ